MCLLVDGYHLVLVERRLVAIAMARSFTTRIANAIARCARPDLAFGRKRARTTARRIEVIARHSDPSAPAVP